MQSKKITITDVALQAGVSVSTVSLVLSGKGRISESTIKRVNQTIDSLGYTPNRQASMLRGGESGVIGLIVSNIAEPFYAEVTAGISEALEQHNKVLFLTQSGTNKDNLTRCFERLLDQGVDGLIIGGGENNILHLKKQADQKNIPLVCVARSSSLEGIDVIRTDNMLAAKLATEHLVKQGHHQIAYLGGSSHSLTRAERLGGFCATLLQYSLPFRSEWVVECDNTQPTAAKEVQKLLINYPKISAIICDQASVALGAYFGVLRTGRTIGNQGVDNYFEQQIALIGFGDTPAAELTDPPLTFVNNSAKNIGYSAVSRLIQRLSGQVLTEQHIIIPPNLIVRGST